MKVGDLVRLKETGELCYILELWRMKVHIQSCFITIFGRSEEKWICDLDELELVK